jgi:hypothetical protein
MSPANPPTDYDAAIVALIQLVNYERLVVDVRGNILLAK